MPRHPPLQLHHRDHQATPTYSQFLRFSLQIPVLELEIIRPELNALRDCGALLTRVGC